MKKEFLSVGKIVGTHGVRGMVRIQPWCDTPEFLCSFKTVYLDENGGNKLQLITPKPHGNVVISTIKNVNSIDDAEKLRNKIIYIKRDDAKLEDDQYFIEELIGCEAIDVDTNELLGIVSDVSQTGANDVWHIKKNDKEYLIPCIDEVVISVDIQNNKVIIKQMKGLFDDED
ncbi:MAG: 16S rRNA processing protein RimM [Clostridia bacterium]|nr:16S rRNA processing protein RimM [Clostridia bacterium]